MNYARDANQFTPICCVDRLHQLVSALVLGVIEECGRAVMFASNQSTTMQVLRYGCSLALRDIELFGDLRGSQGMGCSTPQQQQRFQVRHAVDLIDDKTIDLGGIATIYIQ